MKTKKIENFMLPEHFNKIYPYEASTSLNLTRDVANKINEIIDLVNQYSTDDLEWKQTQEGIIRKAKLYMKDNLLNSLNDLMVVLRDSGFIDDRIEYHCKEYEKEAQELTGRLDNLLSKLKEGSTTGDAELIDIRTGYDGYVFDSAGSSVRNQIEGIANASLNKVDISSYTDNAFIRKTNGTVKEAESYRISDAIEITGSKIYTSGLFHVFTDCDLINFYSTCELLEGSFVGSASPSVHGVVNEIDVPEGATHFFVCTSDEYYSQINVFIGGENRELNKLHDVALHEIPLSVGYEDQFIRANGSLNESTGMVISEPVEITHKKLYFKGHNKNYSSTYLIQFYTNTECSFYGYLSGYQPENASLQEVPIPEGAKYFRVCTGAKQLPLTHVYFSGELLNHEFKRIEEITNKLIFTPEKLNIKIIGDSIANGLRGTGYTNDSGNGGLIYGNFYVNTNGYCWANELKKYLESKFDCSVLNYGTSGVGSDILLSKMTTTVSDDDDIVICAVGTNDRVVGNDAYTGKPRTLESIYKNMLGIYSQAKRRGKEIIFITPIPSSVSDESGRTYHTEDIENLYMKLSAEFGIEVIPMHKLMCEYCDTKGITIDSLLYDGLHPNDEGYEVMYSIICGKLGFTPKRPNADW